MAIPYKLEYYGTGNTPIDITKSVTNISKFTDVGTGEIVSAVISLDARYGDHITESNSDATPIIDQYDLFRLKITDDPDNSYTRYLIQDDISPQKNEEGTHVNLELFGRERFLQKMYFPGHFYFISFRDMIIKIRDFYNDNRGSSQPAIKVSSTDIDDIPLHTYGVFEFGEKTTVYDALMDVVNRLTLPIPAGGAGRYFGLTFSDETQTGFTMLMRIKAQGSLPTSPLTLDKPIKITEVKQPAIGNIVVIRGQEGSGSFPREPALWRSLVEEFENLPLWNNTITYKNGSYVRYGNSVYQARNDHNASKILPTVTASWNVIKFSDYVTAYTGSSSFQYSPYTADKQAVWRNWCGNSGANNGNSFLINAVPVGKDAYKSLCVTDSNLVIRDSNAWRDWADFRVIDINDIPTAYLYKQTTTANTIQKRTYFGMRILLDSELGTPAGVFSNGSGGWATDKFGKSYENSIVMQDRDGDYIVIKSAERFDECPVLSEGIMYEYNTPNTQGGATGTQVLRGKASVVADSNNVAWRNVSKSILGNDCFHYPNIFENTDGLIGESSDSLVTLDNGSDRFTDNSAIKIQYTFGETDVVGDIVQKILGSSIFGAVINLFAPNGTDLKPYTVEEENKIYVTEVYNAGWWSTLWETPFPKSTHNGIGEDVGALFGGNADRKTPVLDLNNLNFTPSGKTGYGHEDSDQLGVIDGFKFLFNFDVEGIDLQSWGGNIPCRAVIYDLLGNVWKSDIDYRFQGDTQEMDFPLSSFSIYRSRIQPAFKLSNAISRIITPELKITEIFERRLVKKINFHVLLSHDDAGRYDPITWEGFLRKIITFVTDTTVTYTGIIDAFHFTKTPIAIARDDIDTTNSVSDRHLMAPIKEYPKISNIAQLGKIASAELDIAKHRQDLWTARYESRADIRAEDSVYIHDEDFIAEEDKTGSDNTRKLIVRKVTYSIGDKSASSGFITTVEMFKEVVGT